MLQRRFTSILDKNCCIRNINIPTNRIRVTIIRGRLWDRARDPKYGNKLYSFKCDFMSAPGRQAFIVSSVSGLWGAPAPQKCQTCQQPYIYIYIFYFLKCEILYDILEYIFFEIYIYIYIYIIIYIVFFLFWNVL